MRVDELVGLGTSGMSRGDGVVDAVNERKKARLEKWQSRWLESAAALRHEVTCTIFETSTSVFLDSFN